MKRVAIPNAERGAALLSVLMIVAAMSVAALLALNALQKSVALTKTASYRSAAEWSLLSAEEAAKSVLGEAIRANEGAVRADTPGFQEPVQIPSNAGLITISLRDGVNCFNLNSLLSDSSVGSPLNEEAMENYRRLLIGADIFAGDARVLTDTLADWLDSDTQPRMGGAEEAYYQTLDVPYRAAGQRLDNLTELRVVAGYTPEFRARLSGLICARPDGRQLPLNINTLTRDQAPLLAAMFSTELSVNDAYKLIETRPIGGWQSIEEFQEADVIQAIAEGARKPDSLAVTTTLFELEARLSGPYASKRLLAVIEVLETGKTETLWRSKEAY